MCNKSQQVNNRSNLQAGYYTTCDIKFKTMFKPNQGHIQYILFDTTAS